ncbi:polyprotein [Variovorax sp. WS11]|uniref:relaxase/mobilization nuclease domain-containing protein n=1 Tax=Variovorax sp. WS11 TaxID=1105204 RepID=UPI000D0D59D6|nr:relaxase/mobilization nuclease domain-containing protein [Variovorax sp. WS11]NDZ13453.1 relaxase/mobilization nuclease domain-containing protein [Variovorax sp. WS11]PSL84440.1 polyprotein [Variovorax sp. WS11]
MIGKKIPNPRRASSKSVRIAALVAYVRGERVHAAEKCSYLGSRGFLSPAPATQTAEMIALSQEAVRSVDPINHYVLSWQESEQPTPANLEGAVTALLDELGLAGHQCIFGAHTDTDNVHLHIVVNRVHPHCLKVIKPNDGFDHDATHRAIAKIEHAQGWAHEENRRYQMLANGLLGRVEPSLDRSKGPSSARRDAEGRTGQKSAVRIAIEVGGWILKSSTSWQQLHERLAAEGIRYEPHARGALLWVGEVAIKFSSVARAVNLPALSAHLGAYRAACPATQPVGRAPEPLRENDKLWSSYAQAISSRRKVKTVQVGAQHQQHDIERKQLVTSQKKERAALFGSRNWKGHGILLNALRSAMATEHAGARAELNKHQGRQRAELGRRYPPVPGFEEWLRSQNNERAANDWRFRLAGERCWIRRAGNMASGSVHGTGGEIAIRATEKFVRLRQGRPALTTAAEAAIFSAYYHCQEDLSSRMNEVDASQLDAMIAAQLLEAGHLPSEIEWAIYCCAWGAPPTRSPRAQLERLCQQHFCIRNRASGRKRLSRASDAGTRND